MEVRLGFLARRVAAPVLLADLMGAGFVGRLLLSPLVAHNALVLAPPMDAAPTWACPSDRHVCRPASAMWDRALPISK